MDAIHGQEPTLWWLKTRCKKNHKFHRLLGTKYNYCFTYLGGNLACKRHSTTAMVFVLNLDLRIAAVVIPDCVLSCRFSGWRFWFAFSVLKVDSSYSLVRALPLVHFMLTVSSDLTEKYMSKLKFYCIRTSISSEMSFLMMTFCIVSSFSSSAMISGHVSTHTWVDPIPFVTCIFAVKKTDYCEQISKFEPGHRE